LASPQSYSLPRRSFKRGTVIPGEDPESTLNNCSCKKVDLTKECTLRPAFRQAQDKLRAGRVTQGENQGGGYKKGAKDLLFTF
jgi:hypothetical protein